MYRTCIFCSSPLGANTEVEAFPVGRSLAFDGVRGRLWVICRGCARWNLSPLEERWEAVEELEKRFRSTTLRVQRENIGLARLPDGTRIVRVGAVVPGELAAWRYGGQLVRRRRRHLLATGAAGAVGLSVLAVSFAGVVAGITAVSGFSGLAHLFWHRFDAYLTRRADHRVVHRIAPAKSPDGRELLIRRWQLRDARLDQGNSGDLALLVPDFTRTEPDPRPDRSPAAPDLILHGTTARTVLGRAMVQVNQRGAKRDELQAAERLLAGHGSAERYLHHIAQWRGRLGHAEDMRPGSLTRPGALALEMALHEETERRALEGELALLEAAWREAEEIAAVADALPDDPLRRLGLRR